MVVVGTVSHMGHHPHLSPLPSRERGRMVGVVLFTLTFDSSPIKGEGDWWVLYCLPARPPPLWIADQVRNDMAWWDCLAVTL